MDCRRLDALVAMNMVDALVIAAKMLSYREHHMPPKARGLLSVVSNTMNEKNQNKVLHLTDLYAPDQTPRATVWGLHDGE